ncbi:MAG: protein kinase [Caldilineaceae bacterium]
MRKPKVGNRPPNQPTDFGSVLYKRGRKLTETRMSEIWFAQRQDGSPVIAKFAMVNEERLAALLMNRGVKGDPEHISEFVQEKNENIRQAIHNNREGIRRYIDVNQAAIANEVNCWLQLQKPGHPGIIRLYPVVQKTGDTDVKYYERSNLPGNPYFLVSEYLPGGTLRDLIGKQQGLPVERALEVLQAIIEVLDYVHGKGFVHLDIKPQNIVFRTPPAPNQPLAAARPTLIDFGICSKEGVAGGGTGTQWWSEPRRWPSRNKGDLTVHRGMDIYSLAMMLRYMLTGEFPQTVVNNGLAAPVHKALTTNALRFEAKLAPEKRAVITKQLNALIDSCLVDDPERRPSTTQLLQRLQQMQAVIGVPKHTPHPRQASWRRGILTVFAALALVIAAFLVISGQLPPILTGMPGESGTPPTAPIAANTATGAPVAGPVVVTDTITAEPPTLAPTMTMSPTASATWTETPTEVPTATATALPPTATPLPPPTSTAQPTSTPIPTNTPTNTPVPVVTRPATPPTDIRVTSLQKPDGNVCGETLQGHLVIRWTVAAASPLPNGYGYDLLIWAPKDNETPFSVRGITQATTGTQVEINVESVKNQRNSALEHNIGVMLVKLAPYQRIEFIGPDNCTFRFAQ